MGMWEMDRDGHHSKWSLPLQSACKADSEPYPSPTMGCAVLIFDVEIVKWPFSHVRLH